MAQMSQMNQMSQMAQMNEMKRSTKINEYSGMGGVDKGMKEMDGRGAEMNKMENMDVGDSSSYPLGNETMSMGMNMGMEEYNPLDYYNGDYLEDYRHQHPHQMRYHHYSPQHLHHKQQHFFFQNYYNFDQFDKSQIPASYPSNKTNPPNTNHVSNPNSNTNSAGKSSVASASVSKNVNSKSKSATSSAKKSSTTKSQSQKMSWSNLNMQNLQKNPAIHSHNSARKSSTHSHQSALLNQNLPFVKGRKGSTHSTHSVNSYNICNSDALMNAMNLINSSKLIDKEGNFIQNPVDFNSLLKAKSVNANINQNPNANQTTTGNSGGKFKTSKSQITLNAQSRKFKPKQERTDEIVGYKKVVKNQSHNYYIDTKKNYKAKNVDEIHSARSVKGLNINFLKDFKEEKKEKKEKECLFTRLGKLNQNKKLTAKMLKKGKFLKNILRKGRLKLRRRAKSRDLSNEEDNLEQQQEREIQSEFDEDNEYESNQKENRASNPHNFTPANANFGQGGTSNSGSNPFSSTITSSNPASSCGNGNKISYNVVHPKTGKRFTGGKPNIPSTSTCSTINSKDSTFIFKRQKSSETSLLNKKQYKNRNPNSTSTNTNTNAGNTNNTNNPNTNNSNSSNWSTNNNNSNKNVNGSGGNRNVRIFRLKGRRYQVSKKNKRERSMDILVKKKDLKHNANTDDERFNSNQEI